MTLTPPPSCRLYRNQVTVVVGVLVLVVVVVVVVCVCGGVGTPLGKYVADRNGISLFRWFCAM
jgi:hypothetical protein